MNRIIVALLLGILFVSLSSCGDNNTEEVTKEIMPMHIQQPKVYYFGIIRSYPDRADLPTEEIQRIQKEHLDNIGRLARDGSMALAGPFWNDENTHEIRGLFIYNVDSKEAADTLVLTDPAVKQKRLTVEVYPWLGSETMTYDSSGEMGQFESAFFYHNKTDEVDFAAFYKQQQDILKTIDSTASIVIAGPFMPDSLVTGTVHSFFVYDIDTLSKVEQLINELPFISDSSLTAKALHWYGPVGLSE